MSNSKINHRRYRFIVCQWFGCVAFLVAGPFTIHRLSRHRFMLVLSIFLWLLNRRRRRIWSFFNRFYRRVLCRCWHCFLGCSLFLFRRFRFPFRFRCIFEVEGQKSEGISKGFCRSTYRWSALNMIEVSGNGRDCIIFGGSKLWLKNLIISTFINKLSKGICTHEHWI